MPDENVKDEAPIGSKKLAYFVLATICVLPFAAGLGLFAVGFLYHKPQLLTYFVVVCMFGSPVLGVLALAGFFFTCFAWKENPRYYILWIVYLLFIVGFVIVGLKSLAGLGPM
jgi:hypothetical protein